MDRNRWVKRALLLVTLVVAMLVAVPAVATAVTVSGTVVEALAPENGVAGATVQVFRWDPDFGEVPVGDSAVTNASGDYSVDVPLEEFQSYGVIVNADGYAEYRTLEANLKLYEGSPLDIDAWLSEALQPAVSVTVLDNATSDPVEGVEVSLMRFDVGLNEWIDEHYAWTDYNGEVTVWFADTGETYRVVVWGAPLDYEHYEGDAFVYAGPTVVRTVRIDQVTLADKTVEGTVTSTAGGSPIANADVAIFSYDAESGTWTYLDSETTNASGYYWSTAPIEAGGAYAIDVMATGYSSFESTPDDVIVYPGSGTLTLNAQLTPLPPQEPISGAVYIAGTSTPIAGLEVVLQYFDDSMQEWVDWLTDTTAANGSYSFDGPPDDHYRLIARGLALGYEDASDEVFYTGDAYVRDFYLTALNNNAPVLASIGAKNVNEGALLSFTASATDADGDTLTYSISGTLTGAAINPSSGAFTWTPGEEYGPDWHAVRVSVSDGKGGSDYEDVMVTVAEVNAPPVLTPIGNKSGMIGVPVTFTASATDTDLPMNELTFSLAGAPAGATIDPSTGAFSWTPSAVGSFTFTVRVHDGSVYDTEQITISVAATNTQPVLAAIGAKNVNELSTLSFTANATDADGDALTYSLGAGAPVGASITAGGAFTWTPSEAQGPGSYTVRVIVSDGKGGSDFEDVVITVAEVSSTLVVTPIEGANRIATAIAASKKAFTTSEYVVVATGFNWPDALGGSALAGALDAPILLTRPDILPAEVRAEIVRLGATKAIVLGGTPAVSAAVASALDAVPNVSVERIAGANRYETANKVAARTIGVMKSRGAFSPTAFVATGMNFPDALGASPLAAAKGWPIYLANPAQGENAGLASTMKAAGITRAVVLGGTNVVSASVETRMRTTLGSALRLAGANRYDTAVKVATWGVANAGLGWNRLAIATGENFPDALAGGVLEAKSGSVMLLTPSRTLNSGVAATLSANKAAITEVRFLGSTAAVSAAVRTSVTNTLK